jgi:hypothetical protein
MEDVSNLSRTPRVERHGLPSSVYGSHACGAVRLSKGSMPHEVSGDVEERLT